MLDSIYLLSPSFDSSSLYSGVSSILEGHFRCCGTGGLLDEKGVWGAV
ncbi:hypothetical protein JK628_22620 [Shewanella sp. KX20019]|nr:hypothetical protein [Shewanella sp. KX20019]QQX80225.1 hypothetical protein JK628_22620 [Shewanella sp. KX20019]